MSDEAENGIERAAQFVAHAGKELGFGKVGFFRFRLGHLQLNVLFLQHKVQAFALGDVARSGEYALQLPVAIIEGGRIERHHRFLAVSGARGELVISDLLVAEHQLDARLGPVGIGEVILERRADQLVARATGQDFHLLVDVGDDAGRIGGHDRVDVGLEQRARVELMVAQYPRQCYVHN